ncbi:hypothetical protein K439DRAFT_1624163 [Ramaria rubella]|nr:hypothetical protein K439DRAFT_1624163 [Ramaria rubella]
MVAVPGLCGGSGSNRDGEQGWNGGISMVVADRCWTSTTLLTILTTMLKAPATCSSSRKPSAPPPDIVEGSQLAANVPGVQTKTKKHQTEKHQTAAEKQTADVNAKSTMGPLTGMAKTLAASGITTDPPGQPLPPKGILRNNVALAKGTHPGNPPATLQRRESTSAVLLAMPQVQYQFVNTHTVTFFVHVQGATTQQQAVLNCAVYWSHPHTSKLELTTERVEIFCITWPTPALGLHRCQGVKLLGDEEIPVLSTDAAKFLEVALDEERKLVTHIVWELAEIESCILATIEEIVAQQLLDPIGVVAVAPQLAGAFLVHVAPPKPGEKAASTKGEFLRQRFTLTPLTKPPKGQVQMSYVLTSTGLYKTYMRGWAPKRTVVWGGCELALTTSLTSLRVSRSPSEGDWGVWTLDDEALAKSIDQGSSTIHADEAIFKHTGKYLDLWVDGDVDGEFHDKYAALTLSKFAGVLDKQRSKKRQATGRRRRNVDESEDEGKAKKKKKKAHETTRREQLKRRKEREARAVSSDGLYDSNESDTDDIEILPCQQEGHRC